MIRKENFRSLEHQYEDIYHSLKQQHLFTYIHKILRPVMAYKKLDIDFYDRRADYKQVLALQDYDDNEIKKLFDQVLYKIGSKDTDEFDCLNDIERTIQRYERYSTRVMKNYDDAHRLHEYSLVENKYLEQENQALRKKAAEWGIDVEKV